MAGDAQIFTLNNRLNQLILETLHPAAWQARPPGNTRTIAAIFTHVHNVRCKWIRLTSPHLGIPAQLNRATTTQASAQIALAESAARCAEMLSESPAFRRDGWSRPWPPGPEMLCYMLSHEAHHRGQICMLAHQLGFPFPTRITSKLWNWERLRA